MVLDNDALFALGMMGALLVVTGGLVWWVIARLKH